MDSFNGLHLIQKHLGSQEVEEESMKHQMESIQYFSRDDSDVGAELDFNYEIKK